MEPIINPRFKIIKSLGQGGMGEIFLADDLKLGRKVAIKSIHADAKGDLDAEILFQREVEVASRLHHPNICAIYEITKEGGREFIVMEYVDGVTIKELLKIKPLALDQVIDIAAQVADGMAAAQAQNIVHNDIKPGNIMIDRSGQVKVLDFGVARIELAPNINEDKGEYQESGRSDKEVILATIAYMSPEQARGFQPDSRSDIFSFGVVLCEMIENRNPFVADEDVVTLYNILHHEVQFNRSVPERLQNIVRKAMQKDRGSRYGEFLEIKSDLDALKTGWR
jgi:serine/threonine protein kinase